MKMARALLSKSHLWRSNAFLNHTTRPLSYFLLHQTPKTPTTLFASAPATASSGHFCPPHRRFCAGAAPVQSPLMQSMEKKIKEQLNAETVTVKDASGDGRHVIVYVISAAFEGQNTVNRQRMVYKAIWEELQDTVHAVHQMITMTPTEAKAKSQ